MQKHLTVLFAFAIFVLLVGWAVTPAQAHCSLNPTHNEKHKTDPCIEGEGDMVIYHVTVSGDLFQIPVDPLRGHGRRGQV